LLNYGEAAVVLGVKVREIRGLVEQDVLHAAEDYRFGISKLLAATGVHQLSERYVATSVLSKRFHLNSVAFARYLRESGTRYLPFHRRTGEGVMHFSSEERLQLR
jgi:hypothetical protein